jgi:16S rRNA G966 N2-methylase RsmD
MKPTELTIPCAYQGGKQRLAKDIVDIFYKENEINDETKFYDLCCGSGAVSIEMVKRGFDPNNIIMVDKSPWGLFWKKVGNGEFSPEVFRFYIDDIPKDITKIKDHAQEIIKEPANDGLFDNMVYKFLILQACAFGSSATWVENNQWKKAGGLRNYWLPTETSNRKSHVNPMMPMPETLYDRVANICYRMDGVIGFYCDVSDIEIENNNSIVYIDPPYKNTSHYGFDLDYMTYIKRLKDCKVYLSEGIKISDSAIIMSGNRKKGGINGSRKSSNEEWLNMFGA